MILDERFRAILDRIFYYDRGMERIKKKINNILLCCALRKNLLFDPTHGFDNIQTKLKTKCINRKYFNFHVCGITVDDMQRKKQYQKYEKYSYSPI